LKKLAAVAVELACPWIVNEECVIPVGDGTYSSQLIVE
jgi:hypothetical protein